MAAAKNQPRAVYVISVAAELAGIHPQTLRIYERKGLVDPARTGGGSRRYSDHDIEQLRRIQELTNEGLNLAGVQGCSSSRPRSPGSSEQCAGLGEAADEAVAADAPPVPPRPRPPQPGPRRCSASAKSSVTRYQLS